LGVSWTTSGCHLGDIWGSFRRHRDVMRTTSGGHLDDICNPSGRHPANQLEEIWGSVGSHIGVMRTTPVGHLDDIWGSFGGQNWQAYHMPSHGAGHRAVLDPAVDYCTQRLFQTAAILFLYLCFLCAATYNDDISAVINDYAARRLLLTHKVR